MLPDYLVAVLFTKAVIGRLLLVIGGGIAFLYLAVYWPGVGRPAGKTVITAKCLTGSEFVLGFSWAFMFLSTYIDKTLKVVIDY